jgi:hypothetical protein
MTNLNHITDFPTENWTVESKPIGLLAPYREIRTSVSTIQGFVISSADAGI